MEFASPIADGPNRAMRSQRAWLARIVLSAAFALVLIALSGTGAAASEPIGTLVDEGAQVLDATTDVVTEASAPLVEPITPAAEPVAQPATGLVGPVLEPIVPEVPSLPSLPSVPLVPATPSALPVLSIVTPISGLEVADLHIDSMADVTVVDRHSNPGPDPVEAPISESTDESLATFAEDVARAGAGVAQGLEQILDVAIPSATFTADGGTRVMAAMLIGLGMVMAAGWSALAGQIRLQPIGLRLAPPVPPG